MKHFAVFISVIFFSCIAVAAEQNDSPETSTKQLQTSQPDQDNVPLTPAKKENKVLKYFELYGYFGFNFRLTHNMVLDGNNPYMSSTALKDVVEDDATGDKSLDKSTGEKLLNWATLKLFLHPVINVGSVMKIHTTFSVFGNILMGSDNVLEDSMENGILRSSQLAANPAILFEGLWGSFDTPIGVLSVGRMPFNWGLGILHSSKNRYTNTVVGDYFDRIQFAVPIAGFTITPAFDFASTSMKQPYSDYFIDSGNQDNGYQVSLIFSKEEKDKYLFKQKLLKEEFVYEFGALATFGWKKKGAGEWDQTTETVTPTTDDIVDPTKNYTTFYQDAQTWQLDGWFKLYYKNFSIRGELAYITGRTGKMAIVNADGSKGTTETVKASMVGAAIEMDYSPIPDKLKLTLNTGIASPDDSGNVMGDSMNMPGNAIDNRSGQDNAHVGNFRFHKEYLLHSAIWDEVLGGFTAGWYVNTHLDYHFTPDIGINGGLTYSMALKQKNSLYGEGLPVALEPYIGFTFDHPAGLRSGLMYQMSIPFSGLQKSGNDAELFHFFHIFVAFVF